jgi:chemotaxis protein MotB
MKKENFASVHPCRLQHCASNAGSNTSNKRTYFLMFFLIWASACVKPKVYKAELSTRQAAEARERVLNRELTDRKIEATSLIKNVSELSRQVGDYEAQIRELNAELRTKTEQMGVSTSKLSAENATLERELANANNQLERRNGSLEKIRKAQQQRAGILADLEAKTVKTFTAKAHSGLIIETGTEYVSVLIPDAALFDVNGLNVSSAGKDLLQYLANLLSEQPELDVEIIAHTDNVLPKDKSLKDTWDWSLQRATNIARLMIREFNTNANQLSPVGLGEFYPLSSNETPEGRQKNRRTIVRIKPVLNPVPEID